MAFPSYLSAEYDRIDSDSAGDIWFRHHRQPERCQPDFATPSARLTQIKRVMRSACDQFVFRRQKKI